jgi:hypothetical protein
MLLTGRIEAIDGSDLESTQALFPYQDNSQNWDDQCDIIAELANLAGLDEHYAQGLSDGWKGIRVVEFAISEAAATSATSTSGHSLTTRASTSVRSLM